MSNEELRRLLDVLSDRHTVKILQETMDEPKSAKKLSEVCDISPQSVYRRTDELTSLGLMETEKRYDPDGHHFTVFSSSPAKVSVEITEETVNITVTTEETMADRLTDFITRSNDQ
ncbi:helix-turn-helix domain-containing protein [Halovenus sp. WSH3]|uniref:Helix-turn-helix domain-containing protein n=1 Tax=Halovenus carboxidivorans TaxID=2692199 RepID=A0A6B0TC45_9EURY|nr:helix-turn-helix domain-containing protein [Halovenus carboxidivorans]MXR52972.1 helix-turn-helix domain-containing protein [Halovenus carboxidivorans]